MMRGDEEDARFGGCEGAPGFDKGYCAKVVVSVKVADVDDSEVFQDRHIALGTKCSDKLAEGAFARVKEDNAAAARVVGDFRDLDDG